MLSARVVSIVLKGAKCGYLQWWTVTGSDSILVNEYTNLVDWERKITQANGEKYVIEISRVVSISEYFHDPQCLFIANIELFANTVY